MGGTVNVVLLYLVAHLVAVCLARLLGISEACKGVDGTLQGGICLKSYDKLIFFVNISGSKGENRRNVLGVNVKHTALFIFLAEKLLYLGIKLFCTLCRSFQKGFITCVGCYIIHDEVTDVYFVCPHSTVKISPCVHILLLSRKNGQSP